MSYAPILLFVYKRLEPLIATIENLKKNSIAMHSDLFIFSDGFKDEHDRQKVNDVRMFLKTITGFKSVIIKEASENRGLAASIINGVTEIFEFKEQVIVLEDDLLTTPNFLDFMNESLLKYEDVQNVFSISGYSFDLGKIEEYNEDAYFLKRGWSWGWASWRDRWEGIDWKVKDYYVFKNDSKSKKEFAGGGSDLNQMLNKQMNGLLDSWAIRWFYHQFKVKGLTLYPIKSKVYNNGFNTGGTNTSGSDRRYRPQMDFSNAKSFNLPTAVHINPYYNRRFLIKLGIIARITSKLETIVLTVKNYYVKKA